MTQSFDVITNITTDEGLSAQMYGQPNVVSNNNTVESDIMKILVADDHEMILDIARMYLAQQPDMEVSTASDLDAAIELFQKSGPFDVVVLDYNMPGMDGIDGLKRMIDIVRPRPVALITGNPTTSLMNQALDEGAAGIISKSLPIKSLANSIRFIHSGETYIPLHLIKDDAKPEQPNTGPLSTREMTVLGYLGEGRKNKDIASELGLSEGTVKMHVMSICKKLEASNRTQAVVNARNTGLL
jgi:two-component system nitrate/nitrite response regulator NarL